MGMVNPYRMRNFSGLAFILGGKKVQFVLVRIAFIFNNACFFLWPHQSINGVPRSKRASVSQVFQLFKTSLLLRRKINEISLKSSTRKMFIFSIEEFRIADWYSSL